MAKSRYQTDGGWSWVVLLACTFISILLFGMAKSSGLLYNELPLLFNIDRTTAASVSSIAGALMSFMGPITGALTNFFSCRQIILVSGICACTGILTCAFASSFTVFLVGYGLIYGTGTGLAIVPARLIITQYFVKKRTLALGLSFSGSCIGGIGFPPLVQFMINTFGLQGALFIMAGLVLNVCVCGMTFIPMERDKSTNGKTDLQIINEPKPVSTISETVAKSEKTPHPNGISQSNGNPLLKDPSDQGRLDDDPRKDSSCCLKGMRTFSRLVCRDFSVLRNVRFLMIAFTSCVPVLCHSGLMISLPDHAQSESMEPLSKSMTAFLVSCTSVGDLMGRLSITWISNKRYVSTQHCYLISILASSVVLISLSFAKTYIGFIACSVLFGCSTGISLTAPTFLVNEYLPQKQWPAAYGFTSMCIGIPILVAGPFLGRIRETTGSYVMGYQIISLLLLITAVPWLLDAVLGHVHKHGTYTVAKEKPDRCEAMRLSMSV